ELNADGSFTYTPSENYFGTDSFTYIVTDGSDSSEPIQVTLTVNPVNDEPEIVEDVYTVPVGTSLVVGADEGLLANDHDVEGDALTATVINGPQHGTLTWNADGSFTYTPDDGFEGPDSFTYQINDGEADSDVAVVHIQVGELNPQT